MMSMSARRELFRETAARYKAASRTEKGRILDELCASTRYHRKYALSLLRDIPTGKERQPKRTRKRIYTADIERALLTLWKLASHPCGKRLAPFLPELIPALERFGEITLDENTRKLLFTISAATIDRLLKKARRQLAKRGMSTTKPGTLLRHQIPIRTYADWDDAKPGFFEVDLVAHCGESTHGEYLNSLVLTDVCVGWTEPLAILNRSQKEVGDAIEAARKYLPHRLLGIDSDNGSEFINNNLKRYCEEHCITFTRCRPYKKNDQCRVEQKNWTVVRQQIGYERYEGQEALKRLKAVYRPLRLYLNFFQPCLKLVSKQRNGAKCTKRYDKAQTPYRRLLAAGILTQEQEIELKTLYEQLNPAELLRQIHKAQERLWSLPKVRNDNEATNNP
jgi:hypothetical protein